MYYKKPAVVVMNCGLVGFIDVSFSLHALLPEKDARKSNPLRDIKKSMKNKIIYKCLKIWVKFTLLPEIQPLQDILLLIRVFNQQEVLL